MSEKKSILKNKKFIQALLMALFILPVFLYANICVAENTDGFDSFRGMYYVLSFASMGLVAAAFYLLLVKKTKLEYVFLLTALVLGLMYSAMIPVRSAPDETMRMESALNSAGNFMGWDTGEQNTMVLRVLERDNGLSETGIVHEYYASYFDRLTETGGDASLVEMRFNYTEEVPQVLYAVPGAGIALGRSLNLGAVPTFLLARLMHLLFYLGAGFYAIRRTPFGKEVFFLVTLLPMTIQETGTISIDSVPLSMVFAVVAFCLYYAFSDKKLSEEWKEAKVKTTIELAVIALFTFLLAGCKYGALLPVCLLLLLIISEKGKRDKMLSIGCLAVLAVDILGSFLPKILYTFQSTVLDGAGEAHYTVGGLLSDPAHTFTVLGNTVNRYGDHYLYSTVGTSLGWFEINFPSTLGFIFLVILVAASLFKVGDERRFRRRTRILIIVLAFFGIAFSVAGMLLGNTPATSEVAEGVQGRYFIPFLLPLLLLLKTDKIHVNNGELILREAILAALYMHVIVIQCLFLRAY